MLARYIQLFDLPGEVVKNPGGVDNKNPMDDLNTEFQIWGGRVSPPVVELEALDG